MKRTILVAMVTMVALTTTVAWAADEAALKRTLASMGTAAGRTFECEVMEDEDTGEFNAWASSNGKLGITPKMLESLKNDDQLAFVLGHEMTHVTAKHHKGQLKRNILGAIAGLVLAKAVGVKDSDDVELGVQVGAGIVGGKYSRKNEYRADSGGVGLVTKAGYKPEAGIEVLEMLQARSGNGMAKVPVIGWLASHPDTGNRVKKLKEEIAKIEKSKATTSTKSQQPTTPPAETTQNDPPASSAYQR